MPRILLIAYYVPPAGGPAVQRILQFIEHLPDAGWAVDVLTVNAGAYPNRDPSLLDAIPETVSVHRTPAFDPLALYQRIKSGDDMPAGSLGDDDGSWMEQVARWIRANVFIPDARVGWWPFAVYRGRQLLDTGRFDAIVTSGAPHSVHLIGRSLHRATRIPWIADLHDPWTDISYYDEFPHTAWARRLDAHFERSVLREASTVTTVSPSWADLFHDKAPNQYAVIENGFDADRFANVQVESNTAFTLAHVGKLYASRNPTAVWDALATLREQGAIPELRVELTGTVDPVARRSIERHDLTSIVTVKDFVPHHEAIRRMARSTLLLLVIEPFAQAEGMITSKLYEYLASGRPVLGVGPPDGDAAALLREHDAGAMVSWGDAEQAASVLRAHYEAWAAGSPRPGASWDDIQVHNRRQQAQRLADVLTAAVDASREPRSPQSTD